MDPIENGDIPACYVSELRGVVMAGYCTCHCLDFLWESLQPNPWIFFKFFISIFTQRNGLGKRILNVFNA